MNSFGWQSIDMENTETSSLFTLSIEPETKVHLLETARWARFLAIVGMVCLGLLVVFGLFYSIWISSAINRLQSQMSFPSQTAYDRGIAAGSALMFVVMAVVGFFPLLYMFRFSSQMRTALYGNDQENLNSSFRNLKRYFRYFGVITLVGMGIWIIWLLVMGTAIFSLR
jgi:ABC-type multidrug transport system fused ATPase/permease subunit